MSFYLSKNAVEPLTPLSEERLYSICWNEDDEKGEEMWCRVLIRSIQKAQDKAYVLCPDFGNSLLVSTRELKELPQEFYELPFQVGVYIISMTCTTYMYMYMYSIDYCTCSV